MGLATNNEYFDIFEQRVIPDVYDPAEIKEIIKTKEETRIIKYITIYH